jgi:hypothetical protein
MKNTAGQEITPPFTIPCLVQCGSTGGCNSCRTGYKQSNTVRLPVGTFPFGITVNEGISKEDEKRFYKKVLSNH